MSAFIVATSTIKDPEKMQEYAQKSMATIAAFGAELVVRGVYDRTLTGDKPHSSVAVIRFPNSDSLNRWYSSDAYQQLTGLREAAADITLTAYQVPA